MQQDYIIDKLVVDVNTKNSETAYYIKDHVSSFLQNSLLPQIELIFEKYNPEKTVVRFNELEVDLAIKEWKNQESIKAEICFRLEEKLRTKIPFAQTQNGKELSEKVVRKISPEKNRENIFLFFLENGYLPWFGKQEHISEIVQKRNWEKSLQNEYFTEGLQKLLKRKEKAFNRLILQFSEDTVLFFLSKINKNFVEEDLQIISLVLKDLSHNGANMFLQLVGNVSIKEKDEALKVNLKLMEKLIVSEHKLSLKSGVKVRRNLQQAIQKIQPRLLREPKLKEWFQSGVAKKQDFIPDEKETHDEYFDERTKEIPVVNAGLIILHPFFQSLFKELKIIDKQKQIIAGRKELAVQVLHYLATGDEDFFEGNLTMEKFVCGIPLNWPVQKESLLTRAIKSEADALLDHVVKLWTALKNTSAGGFRQLFLQRNGKLLQNKNRFKLIVERKAQDVLLEKLDWNISVIKLPWIEQLLYVDW